MQTLVENPGPEPEPDQALVEVAGRPVGETPIDRPGEREQALGDAAGRGDDDDHQDLGLEGKNLDVADGRGLNRRSGDDRHQVGDLRQRLGGDAHGLVELVAHQRQGQGRTRRLGREQAIDEVPVPGLGRDASGRGVGMSEETELLEVGQLVADRRRSPLKRGAQRFAAHGRPIVEVLLDEAAQNQFLALGEHGLRL